MAASLAASAIGYAASNLASKAFGIVAKDRSIVIPIDNPGETEILSKIELEKKFCGPKQPKKKRITVAERKKMNKRKSNLNKLLDSLG